MKLNKAKIPSYVSGLQSSKQVAALVYGPDVGGVSNLGKEIASKIVADVEDPFLSVNIDSGSLEEDETIIYDEMMAISFGGGKRLVTIKNVEGAAQAKNIIASLEQLPEDIYNNSFLVITAGDLPVTSALRKFFEDGKQVNFAAIPCYKEDARDLTSKIFNLVQKKGIHIEPEAVNFVANSCQGDSLLVEHEVEKLSLYCAEKGKITYEDVLLATGNSTEIQIQDLCESVFSSDRAKIEISYQKAVESGLAPIAILRSLQKYIEKLHQAYYYVKDGNTVELAMKYIKPPIFFKQVPTFKLHLGKLLNKSEGEIYAKYGHILKAEFDTKQSNSEPDIITSRVLQKIAA